MPIFAYVVCLNGAFILDGGNKKRTLWQGVVYVAHQLVHFQVSLVLFRSIESQPLDHFYFEIYCTQRNDLYSDRWVQASNQRWMTYCFLNLLLVLVKI